MFEREDAIEDGPLRPDLVIVTPGKAIIVDVTVRFEQDNSLEEAMREKIDKYRQIFAAVKRDMGVSDVKVLPVVIGSRGAMPRATIKNLEALGIVSTAEKSMIIPVIPKHASLCTPCRFLQR